MSRSCAAAFLAATLLASAQTPKPGRVEGSVTNSATGAPIKKANIVLMGPGKTFLSVATDANGHFSFENVAPGTYGLQLNCLGYATAPGTRQPPVVVAEQQEIKDIQLKLTPNGVVTGRVLDEDGEPMVQVQVEAWRYTYDGGRRRLGQGASTATNDLGEFRMIDVLPGRYFFQATPQPTPRLIAPRMISTLRSQAYPATFYPNAMDISQCAAQIVNAGAELSGIEFHIRKSATYHVRGKLMDAQTGQAPENTTVSLGREGRGGNMTARVAPDGTFDLPGIAPGQYTLVATKMNGKPRPGVARQAITVSDGDVDGLSLTLESGSNISGSVMFEGDQPAGKQRTLQIWLVALDVAGMGAGQQFYSTVKEDGSFELLDVPSGTFAVTASALVSSSAAVEGKYLKFIQLAGREVPDGIIDLTQQHGGSLHLVYGADPGSIRGTTSPNMLVTAVPSVDGAIRMDQFHFTFSDESGNLKIANLAPGDYRVTAWETADVNMPQVAEIRKLLESKAATVRVAPSGNASVQLVPIPSADIDEAIRKLP